MDYTSQHNGQSHLKDQEQKNYLSLIPLFLTHLSLALIFMGFVGCTEKTPAPLDVGDHFPALTLEDLLDRPVALPRVPQAKVSLVSIRTLGCRFCASDFAELEKLYHVYKRNELDITVISIGFDSKEVKDFLREKPVSFPILLDPKMSSMHLTHTVILPVAYLLDQNSKIIARLTGGFSFAEIQSLLNEHPSPKEG